MSGYSWQQGTKGSVRPILNGVPPMIPSNSMRGMLLNCTVGPGDAYAVAFRTLFLLGPSAQGSIHVAADSVRGADQRAARQAFANLHLDNVEPVRDLGADCRWHVRADAQGRRAASAGHGHVSRSVSRGCR
jgi:hypothetical protein